MTIGEKMKEIRKERGWSQEQLAEELIVSRAAVAKWESDKGIPDIDNLKKLSELFGMSIDELVGNSVTEKEQNNISNQKYYIPYIGKKCNVEMVDWNDGIFDSYLVNQDENFIYYLIHEKKHIKAGILTKQYIEKVTLCSQKEKTTVDITEFSQLNKEYFVDKNVDIYLEDKNFLSGVLGKDTEMPGVGIVDFNEEYVTLMSGMKIETKQITKIEVEIK